MLTRTRNTNELQRFTPFSLIEWESPWRAFGSLKQDLDRLFGAYERSVAEPYSDTQDAGAIRDTGNELRARNRFAGRFQEGRRTVCQR